MAVKSGDACPECGHYFTVVDTVERGASRIQYLGCKKCGHRPPNNKRVLGKNDPTPRFRRVAVST